VVSDAHTGLKQAIAAVMAGAGWQRCRVHFLRNVLARVPRGSAEMVAAAIRTIFAQPTGVEVVEQLDKVAVMLAPKFPAVARMLTDAREDLTALASFPPAGPSSGAPTRWSGSTRDQAPHQRGRDLPR
jgi:putative transposase